MDYKEHSLNRLKEWLHDCLGAAEASPQEIYDAIKEVVQEEYYYYKNGASKTDELLSLLNGNGKGHISAYDDVLSIGDLSLSDYDPSMSPWGHSDLEYQIHEDKIVSCDRDNQSTECQRFWNDFWEDSLHSEHYYDYERNDSNKENPFEKKWIVPVEEDPTNNELFVTFPDDLIKKVGWGENDNLEWVDNDDGSWTLKKVENPTSKISKV